MMDSKKARRNLLIEAKHIKNKAHVNLKVVVIAADLHGTPEQRMECKSLESV